MSKDRPREIVHDHVDEYLAVVEGTEDRVVHVEDLERPGRSDARFLPSSTFFSFCPVDPEELFVLEEGALGEVPYPLRTIL
jgi:hypothetical protein